jgi:hypothetical protein
VIDVKQEEIFERPTTITPKCPFCEVKFEAKELLKQHLVQHFSNETTNCEILPDFQILDPTLKCLYCKKYFKTKKAFINHKIEHYKEFSFHFSKCEQKCYSTEDLNRQLLMIKLICDEFSN